VEKLLDGRVVLYAGDCLGVLPTLPADHFDSCVTDPPYGLGFMGRAWDRGVPGVAYWREVLRVLKPGAHLVACGGTRTYHRLACAIDDAGFEMRDMVAWLYGTGFPKSLDVSKAIDKEAGAVRKPIGPKTGGRYEYPQQDITGGALVGAANAGYVQMVTLPATHDARTWEGWGTGLKPAIEPIVLARKPLSEATVAANVLRWGTGALNIDGCRIESSAEDQAYMLERISNFKTQSIGGNGTFNGGKAVDRSTFDASKGRWPANVVHDGSTEVVSAFPDEAGGYDKRMGMAPGQRRGGFGDVGHDKGDDKPNGPLYGDSGSAARFFYWAKADDGDRLGSPHPTIKPVDLMRWLCRLVTRPGGMVLEPFAGTGTTGEAAWLEGMRAVLIEIEAQSQADIRKRMTLALSSTSERRRETVKRKIATGRIKADDGPLFGEGKPR
jgi:DNA modification methylase